MDATLLEFFKPPRGWPRGGLLPKLVLMGGTGGLLWAGGGCFVEFG